ncbi:class I SAM-dependent methyltransferase [Paenibacillus mesophilus]|uniref:class I SAM-dependent methyltransferase n=1 Tax=Paenibacillus mesophilus TaxID=2582849 RepID=UPI00110F36D7|nr:class I SAM-dependent methyltransferase [Paenibacillus mesophilus]TMV47231.1 class I SAM-dependent methyltransferase [Paenibacillus mesophilus]
MPNKHTPDLITAYNNHAEERNHMQAADWKVRERGQFLDMLKRSKAATLLEIGSGPGRDSLFFSQEGLDVTSTDQSPEMVRLCREKGLKAEVRSFDALGFPDRSFDAVFGLNCLLHVPKSELRRSLEEIRRVLKPDGLFYMGVYGGPDSEGIWEKDSYEPKRFFAMYSDENLLKAVSGTFEIVYFNTEPLGEGNPHFQSLVLKAPQ